MVAKVAIVRRSGGNSKSGGIKFPMFSRISGYIIITYL
jgi:hypothetical protein